MNDHHVPGVMHLYIRIWYLVRVDDIVILQSVSYLLDSIWLRSKTPDK